MVCGGLRLFAVNCGGLSFSHTDFTAFQYEIAVISVRIWISTNLFSPKLPSMIDVARHRLIDSRNRFHSESDSD